MLFAFLLFHFFNRKNINFFIPSDYSRIKFNKSLKELRETILNIDFFLSLLLACASHDDFVASRTLNVFYKFAYMKHNERCHELHITPNGEHANMNEQQKYVSQQIDVM